MERDDASQARIPDVTVTRPPGALGWSITSMLVGAGTAFLTGIALSGGDWFCSVIERLSGANIAHAAAIVGAGTIIGVILAVIGRNDPRFLSVTLLLTAAALLFGLVLMGVDYAVARQRVDCGLFGSDISTETVHLWIFGVVWAAAAIVLLWQAARLVEVTETRRLWVCGIVLLVCGWFVVRAVQGPAPVARASHTVAKHAVLPAGTKRFAEPNHDHVAKAIAYDHTPPAGGAHADVWLNCGVYGHPVRNENAVHSLEHGTVWITYRPGLSTPAVKRLRRLVQRSYRGEQRYLLLSPYPGLPAPVVASAWGAQLRLRGARDPRLKAFISHFAGGGQGGEPGAYCTGGIGSPIG